MPRLDPAEAALLKRDDVASWRRARELQKTLYDGGFAGICFPREYGGLGLSYQYKTAFDAESAAYEIPILLNVPSFAICCATILDTGSEEQKRTHIAAALRGAFADLDEVEAMALVGAFTGAVASAVDALDLGSTQSAELARLKKRLRRSVAQALGSP
jgi:alkylation response protein AidB-like acyl-CoA dehydrogenase